MRKSFGKRRRISASALQVVKWNRFAAQMFPVITTWSEHASRFGNNPARPSDRTEDAPLCTLMVSPLPPGTSQQLE
jgi:hypothetical protein